MTAEERKERFAYLESIKCVHPEKCLNEISCQKDYQRLLHRSTQEKQCLDFVVNKMRTLDISDFLKAKLSEVYENQDYSLFPDFLFSSGFIEHFQITASKENKKGSAYRKKEAEHKRNLDMASIGVSESFVTPHSAHNNIKESLKRNWESHIRHMDEYLIKTPDVTTRIFMIEHTEMTLEMAENVYAYEDDFSIPQRHFSYYSLSHDVEMLDYIYSFKDKIDYVIYRHSDGIEVIELSRIPTMKKSLKYPFIVCSLFQTRISTVLTSWENSDLVCFHSRGKAN